MRPLKIDELEYVSGGEEETVVEELVIYAKKRDINEGGSKDDGGFYLNLKLAAGIGVSVTFSGSGVDAGFLTGVAAGVEVGHASSEKNLVDEVKKNEQFVEGKIGALDLKAERDTKTGEVKIEGELSHVNVNTNGGGGVMGVTVDNGNWSFGVSAGAGVETYLGHREWYTPGDAKLDSAQAQNP